MSGDLRSNGGGILQCVAKAVAAPLSPKTKILFSQRGLQFAEDFGSTVQRSELIRTIVEVASAQVIKHVYYDKLQMYYCYHFLHLRLYKCIYLFTTFYFSVSIQHY